MGNPVKDILTDMLVEFQRGKAASIVINEAENSINNFIQEAIRHQLAESLKGAKT